MPPRRVARIGCRFLVLEFPQRVEEVGPIRYTEPGRLIVAASSEPVPVVPLGDVPEGSLPTLPGPWETGNQVHGRIEQSDAMVQRLDEQIRHAIELRRHETGASGLEESGWSIAGVTRAVIVDVAGLRVGVGGDVRDISSRESRRQLIQLLRWGWRELREYLAGDCVDHSGGKPLVEGT